MEAIGGLLLLAAVLAGYFLPTIIAASREHHNVGAIVVVNFLLGWTFIGWVVALAMSAGEVRHDPRDPRYRPAPRPRFDPKTGERLR